MEPTATTKAAAALAARRTRVGYLVWRARRRLWARTDEVEADMLAGLGGDDGQALYRVLIGCARSLEAGHPAGQAPAR